MPLPLLDEVGAMTTLVVATDAFAELAIGDMPQPLREGVVLLYDAILARVSPHLPTTDAMQGIRKTMDKNVEVAALIRKKYRIEPGASH
jgi:hypothetical protein